MIKLLNKGSIDGVTRLQSQLRVGKDSCDFILENGVLKNWSSGNKGFDFYPIDIEYQIVNSIEEMKTQKL